MWVRARIAGFKQLRAIWLRRRWGEEVRTLRGASQGDILARSGPPRCGEIFRDRPIPLTGCRLERPVLIPNPDNSPDAASSSPRSPCASPHSQPGVDHGCEHGPHS